MKIWMMTDNNRRYEEYVCGDLPHPRIDSTMSWKINFSKSSAGAGNWAQISYYSSMGYYGYLGRSDRWFRRVTLSMTTYGEVAETLRGVRR